MKHAITLTTLVGMALSLGIIGCATSTGGASDSDQINALLGKWKAGVVDANVDAIMATYSERFSHDGYDYDAEDKASLKEFIAYSISDGSFDEVEVYLEDARIEIEGDTATVYPIDYAISAGSISIELVLAKEKGGWLITDMVLEGI